MANVIPIQQSEESPVEYATPSDISAMPTIFRVTTIRHTTVDRRRTESTATLFREQAAIKVTWSGATPDLRIRPGGLVSPRWQVRAVSDEGAIRISRLVLLERPEPLLNMFATVPPGWARDRDLVKVAAGLVDELPKPYRHLVNAVLWDGERFRRFCKGPSSCQHHHSRENGNLAHSVDVATLMRDLCRTREGARPDLGILLGLLHDVGKADEYRLGPNGGWVMTSRGVLLGHDHTRDEWIAAAMAKNRIGMTENQRQAIAHCLSAKANVPDWMGMRRPRMIEAHLLSHADRISGEWDLNGLRAANDPG